MNFYKRSFDFLSDANNDFKEYSLEYFLLNIQANNIFFSELILCYNRSFMSLNNQVRLIIRIILWLRYF